MGNSRTSRLEHGDCLEVMKRLADEGVQVDSIVCDPPYHLTSIVKRFGATNAAPAKHGTDGAYARASRGFMGKQWDGGDIAFRPETWELAFALLKPGGHLVAFSGPRTYHRMVCAIEDAGFEIRDQLAWVYGTGFPKSHNLDGEWQGWGTALKPAWEPIVLARKPLIGTVAENVLEHGTGAINIDGCRVESSQEDQDYMLERVGGFNNTKSIGGNGILGGGEVLDRSVTFDPTKGRFPANIIHDGSDEVVGCFPNAIGQIAKSVEDGRPHGNSVYSPMKHGGPTHIPRIEESKSAARFFYCAKASKSERSGSKHPTVKPIALMQYLCRLITPPSGVVLDPFAGSGTTGVAALREGFSPILIEREDEYVEDIKRRLQAEQPEPEEVDTQLPLFA